MEKVTAYGKDLLVGDLYEIRALINGFVHEGKVVYGGFVNEKNITEGQKRRATKIAKQINTELESIDAQRLAIKSYSEESLTEEDLIKIRKEKDNELLSDPIDFSVEKLDFKHVENLSLAGNYQFLYDTIFKE